MDTHNETEHPTDHKLHFIGRVECVTQGCEPDLPPRPVLPNHHLQAESRELARRPFIRRRV